MEINNLVKVTFKATLRLTEENYVQTKKIAKEFDILAVNTCKFKEA